MNTSFAELNLTFFSNLTRTSTFIINRKELLAWIVITLTISFTGVISNFLVFLATWPRNPHSGTTGINMLIFNFVTANLFMCLVNIPISVFMVLARFQGYPTTASFCVPIHAIFTINSNTINWAEAELSINRCIALFFPHHYKAWITRRVNLAFVSFAWAISFAGTVPMCFRAGGFMTMNLPLGQCAFIPVGQLGSFLVSVLAYIPYAIAGLGSVMIFWKTCMSSRVVGTLETSRRIQLRRLKMAKMLLCTSVWIALCNMPWGISVVHFPRLSLEYPMATLWIRTMLPCQYCITPCILLCFNMEYRARLRQIWQSVVRRENNVGLGRNGTINNNSSNNRTTGNVQASG